MKKEDNVKKEWMTPDELALITGYSRQTINKWIKRHSWSTAPKPGVQGGKARLIHITPEVEQYLQSVNHAMEPSPTYRVEPEPLTQLLLNSLGYMSAEEKHELMSMLLREGVKGLLDRLGISGTPAN